MSQRTSTPTDGPATAPGAPDGGAPDTDPSWFFAQSEVAGLLLDAGSLRVIACNAAGAALWGAPEPTMVDRSLDSLCASADDAIRRGLSLARASGEARFAWPGAGADGARWTANARALRCAMSGRERLWVQLRVDAKGPGEVVSLARTLLVERARVRELHHRINNNLQIIESLFALQGEETTEPSARGALRDAGLRVRAVELVHRFLDCAEGTSTLDFAEYAQALCLHVRTARDLGAHISLVSDAIDLPFDQAVPCGLIVHELLLEAIERRLDPGGRREIHVEIHVEIHEDSREISVAVSDRTPRAEERTDGPVPVRARLLAALTRQLRARLRREAPTRVQVWIPLASDEGGGPPTP
jgi:two-component sensor histidine kinase